MKKFNLSKPEKYTSNGVEKTFWSTVGTMTQFDDGKMLVEIPAIGLKASVFPQDRKPSEKISQVEEHDEPTINVDEGEVNPDDIPF